MSHNKIQKPRGRQPDEFEKTVAAALYDLESHVNELKTELRQLHITAAKEVYILYLLLYSFIFYLKNI